MDVIEDDEIAKVAKPNDYMSKAQREEMERQKAITKGAQLVSTDEDYEDEDYEDEYYDDDQEVVDEMHNRKGTLKGDDMNLKDDEFIVKNGDSDDDAVLNGMDTVGYEDEESNDGLAIAACKADPDDDIYNEA